MGVRVISLLVMKNTALPPLGSAVLAVRLEGYDLMSHALENGSGQSFSAVKNR